MGTFADALRELANLLDKDFDENKKEVSQKLVFISKAIIE